MLRVHSTYALSHCTCLIHRPNKIKRLVLDLKNLGSAKSKEDKQQKQQKIFYICCTRCSFIFVSTSESCSLTLSCASCNLWCNKTTCPEISLIPSGVPSSPRANPRQGFQDALSTLVGSGVGRGKGQRKRVLSFRTGEGTGEVNLPMKLAYSRFRRSMSCCFRLTANTSKSCWSSYTQPPPEKKRKEKQNNTKHI